MGEEREKQGRGLDIHRCTIQKVLNCTEVVVSRYLKRVGETPMVRSECSNIYRITVQYNVQENMSQIERRSVLATTTSTVGIMLQHALGTIF